MFVVLYTYSKPLEEVDNFRSAHLAFLDKQYAAGHFVVSGRQNPPTGGVLISHLASREQLEDIVRQDPYILNGVATYQVIEFLPAKYAAGFEVFLRQ
ncbi:MAG: YciI family protein [Candidatus Thermochlorobacter sp.]